MRRSLPVDAPPPVARAREAMYDRILCDVCGSGDRDEEMLLCDGCDRGRHIFCLRPIAARVPTGPWFCPACAPPAKPLKSESCEAPRELDLAISIPAIAFSSRLSYIVAISIITFSLFFVVDSVVGTFRVSDEADKDH